MARREISFGPFRFDAAARTLWDGSVPVRLGSRASAILGLLLEAPGERVSRDTLIQRAWYGLHVDQANLRVQISGLRKALREFGGAIRADPSQGYRFVADVVVAEPASRPFESQKRFRVPGMVVKPIGREAEAAGIHELFKSRRLVTILGPGGIGKTTIALQVANDRAAKYADGVCFADLGRVSSADLVYSVVANAIELGLREWPQIDHIVSALRDRRMLLVLDCCEHVLDPVARLVESLLSKTSYVDILVTTREPLQLEQEAAWRLAPLAVPPKAVETLADDIKAYSSVQLFLKCVDQRGTNLHFDDRAAAAVSEVCRRLDGIPLAIEIAASMTAVLGFQQVLRSLDEQSSLLNIRLDRRSAVPRQRSLFSTIDWSYSLLSKDEQAALRRLACFAGAFSIDAGIAVTSDDHRSANDAREVILGLSRRSLLYFDSHSTLTEYRLLDTTRAYIAQLDAPAGELDTAQRRHAEYFLRLLDAIDWDLHDAQSENAKMRAYLDEVRVALEWAFRRDPELGVRLVLAAEKLWLALTSLVQGVPYLTKALQFVENKSNVDAAVRCRLLVSLASAQVYLPGFEGANLYERAWQAAQHAKDDFAELRALYGIIQNLLLTRRPATPHLHALGQAAERSDDPNVHYLLQRISAFNDFETSAIRSAHQKFETFLHDCPSISRSSYLYFGGIDSFISCKIGLALAKYYMGYCEQALSLANTAVDEAEVQGHLTTNYFVLAQGALWVNVASGEFDRAHGYLQRLNEISRLYRPWHAVAEAFRALLLKYASGDAQTCARILTDCLADEFIVKTGSLHPILWVELADSRRIIGDLDGADSALEKAMSQCLGPSDVRLIGKHNAILARVLMARNRPGDLDAARELLRHAIDLSRQYDFYLYECEATVGLAELERLAGQPSAARHALIHLLSNVGDRRQVPFLARARTILIEIDISAPSGSVST
ncbi:winged helix-turn-helix domain-containing protein [Bradyrhizobium lablabi]|uniref:ATP-binding protein n=1 Tax=Bradyrhizobium lablabi TaxID=722472 RepID=UPI001BAD3944|nr:winged helix-turn-helix domain-containing protein [Bradyrhizobium lablabi]MBR1123038.1 winged helix-turn-helix domain-containing protein [Bradyrhizobium lablabi]